MEIKIISRDLVIIGGGAAGCYAGVTARRQEPDLDITIIEKAHIERSGCLAAGINAINAYINPGETPESFLEYVKKDSHNLIRDDLVYSIACGINKTVATVEKWGLPILKDENGNYLSRSSRSIKIKGEKFKPILANKVREERIEVLNRTVATNYIVENGRVKGCFAFNIRKGIFYVIRAKAVICATGGASGIYKPNNEGKARHKMWYPPFNTGAGYAMGIRAGAEMTTLEMRFVALRVKDVIAPTGTFAFAGATQENRLGEEYLQKYDQMSTCMRLYATVQEEKAGRGPCYLNLSHLDKTAAHRLYDSLLDMCPDLVLQWEEKGVSPDEIKLKIEGTEPYLVGGHCQAGYWIDINRRTTVEGLYAAGDVAGGAPKKYVSGAFVEGKIAAENAVNYLKRRTEKDIDISYNLIKKEHKRLSAPLNKNGIKARVMEKQLQQVMDEYAGGKSNYYELEENQLLEARKMVRQLKKVSAEMGADNLHELMSVQEVLDKLEIAAVLIEHLLYRKETRWPGYQTRKDYPDLKPEWRKFINSRYNKVQKQIEIIEREYKPLAAYKKNNIERGVVV
ncbi:MAG: adenylyl-sulfate reductase subunit alpha [Halanaerobiales bacterium]